MARDQDLQKLRKGLVFPAAPPPLSWEGRQEAFDNYLRLIYASDMLVGVGSVLGHAMTFTLSDTSFLFFLSQNIKSGREFLQWNTAGLATEKECQDKETQAGAATSGGQATLSVDVQPVSSHSAFQTPGAPGRRFARPPRVSLPIPPTHRVVHSRASQVRPSALPISICA